MKDAATSARDVFSRFRAQWAASVGIGAAIVTACDAVLLQRSKNYFTGGFLSVDHLEGPLDIALFTTTSFLVDAAFIGLVTALIAWLLPSRLRPPTRLFAGALFTTSTLVVADIISYGVLR